jgi:hypothetical protein
MGAETQGTLGLLDEVSSGEEPDTRATLYSPTEVGLETWICSETEAADADDGIGRVEVQRESRIVVVVQL